MASPTIGRKAFSPSKSIFAITRQRVFAYIVNLSLFVIFCNTGRQNS